MDFPDLLARMAVERGLSLRCVAQRAGMDPSYLNRVRHGSRPMPADRIHPVADALGLDGDERAAFVEQAHLSVVPEFVLAMISGLRENLTCCQAEKAELEERLRQTVEAAKRRRARSN